MHTASDMTLPLNTGLNILMQEMHSAFFLNIILDEACRMYCMYGSQWAT